ncbi:MAG: DUF2147 domain-containing protein [Bacteroidota bacterium]
MKTLITMMAILLSLTTSFAQNADNITGVYWSPHKDAKIEIYKRGDKYFGKSVWVANPRKDTENPDRALQSREVQGIELLTNFTFDRDTYKGGKIYDPESGKTYSCKINLEGNSLKVRGYIGIALLGRTEIFERIK